MPPFSLILTIFVIANPIGYIPAILAQVKQFPFTKQRWIVIRESFFALLLGFFFQFCGNAFLSILNVQSYAVSICGGTILFLSALEMIFPLRGKNGENACEAVVKEPYIVPIATPFLAGGGLLTVVMLYSQQWPAVTISLAITAAWVGVFSVMMIAPYLYRLIGTKGFAILEQVMGMITVMLSLDLVVSGFGKFLQR